MVDAELDQILQRCKRRNPKAQEQLYRRYYSYGLTICLHYAKNREEAEEILHDGFLSVFGKLHQFAGRSSFRAWFRRILVHAAIDYHRKHHLKKESVAIIAIKKVGITENEAIAQLDKEDAWKILQVLSPAYRLVFNLSVLEGYTHKEIAKKLNISIGTSKSNLAKARKRLKQLIGPIYHKNSNSLNV